MYEKILKNKKGVMTFDMLMHLPRIFFTLFVGAIIALLVLTLINVDTDIREKETYVIVDRLLYSEQGITYVDPDTGRVYPGIIDSKKFNEYTLEHIFTNPNNIHFAMELTLSTYDLDRTIIYNRRNYVIWEDVQETGAEGIGGARLFEHRRPVIVFEDDKLVKAILKIAILMPNG